MDIEITKRVLASFEREDAVARSLLGLALATEPLDLFIAPERDNVERLKAALRSVFADPAIEEISTDELLADYPAVQYIPPEGDFHLDILTRLGEAFQFADLEAVRVPMEDSLWREPGEPELWRAIDRVWRFAAKTCPRRFPPGVYRHRSIEEAKQQREVWDEANFRAFWERRGVNPTTLGQESAPAPRNRATPPATGSDRDHQ